jgi:hypothetical protein
MYNKSYLYVFVASHDAKENATIRSYYSNGMRFGTACSSPENTYPPTDALKGLGIKAVIASCSYSHNAKILCY